VDVLSTTSEDFKEQRLVNFLLKEAATFKIEEAMGAYRNNAGTTIHPFNKSSESQDIFRRFETDKEYLQTFTQDEMYVNTFILGEALNKSDPTSLELFTMDTVADSDVSNSGLKNGQQSSFDAIAAKIIGYVNAPGPKTLFLASSPTFADRGLSRSIVVPKINVTTSGADKEVYSSVKGKTKIESTEIKTWIRNQIRAELSRIIKAKNLKLQYKNYNERAVKLTLFEQLNEYLDPISNKLNQGSKESILNFLMEKMDTIFPQIIENDINFLIDNHILTNQKTPGIGQAARYQTVKDAIKYVGKEFRHPTRQTVQNFLANNFIYNYEQILFYAGDPAFFKSKVDLNKRLGLTTTPGTKIASGEGTGVSETYKMTVVNDPETTSTQQYLFKNLFEDKLFKKAGDAKKVFTKTEIADGTTISSVKRYRQILLGQGIHNKTTLDYLDAVIAWSPNEAHVKIPEGVYLPVVKSFNSQLRLDPATNIVVPTSQKTSLFPAIPSFFEEYSMMGKMKMYKHSGMAEISKHLREGKADEVSVLSAVKTGAKNVVDVKNISSSIPTTMYNTSYRFPQVSTSTEEIEARFGSQIRKLITADLVPSRGIRINGKAMTESGARLMYEQAIKEILIQESSKLTNEFITDGNLNEGRIIGMLLDSLEGNNIHKNVEFFEKALEVTENETYLPLNHPVMAFAIDSAISSAYRNKNNRFSVPGYQAVQITSMGMEATKSSGQLSVASDLKFVGIANLDGTPVEGRTVEERKDNEQKIIDRIKKGEDLSSEYKITPAEIRVTHKYFKKAIEKSIASSVSRSRFEKLGPQLIKQIKKRNPNINDGELSRLVTSAIEGARNKVIKLKTESTIEAISDKTGNISIKLIQQQDPTLLETVLYRIPTQAKSSMLPAVIVEFLPESMSSTIQVPGEIVEQSGSDFDIDKVFIQNRGFNLQDGKFKAIEGDFSVPIADDKRIVEPSEVANILNNTVSNNKNFIKITANEKNYLNTKDNQLYQRTTSYIKEIGDTNAYLESASVIGTGIDSYVRDFFAGKIKDLNEYNVASPKLLKGFNTYLTNLKKSFDETGQTVIANDMVVYDKASKVAGTIDLITYDKGGKVRIYDMKTMRQDKINRNKYGEVLLDSTKSFIDTGKKRDDGSSIMKIDPINQKESDRTVYSKQLSIYRAALFNTHGILADELYMIPIKVDYEAGESTTKELVGYKLEALNILDQVKDVKIESNTPKLRGSEAKKFLFDFQYSVLTSPNTLRDMLLPTNTLQLEKLTEEFGYNDDMYSDSLGSISLDEKFRSNNKSGTELISVFSIASTAHSIAKYIGVEPVNKITIDGNVLDFTQTNLLKEDTGKISDVLKELQNAALDNANNPILGKLNVDLYTSSVVNLLVSAGHPLEYAINLINAPIIRDLTKLVESYDKIYGKGNSKKKAKLELFKRYGINKRGKKGQYNIASYTIDKAKNNRTITESSANFSQSQAEALAIFEELKEIGDKFSLFQTTMNQDSSGPKSSAAGLVKQVNRLRDIQGTVANRQYGAFNKTKLFRVTSKLYDEHSVSSFEKYSIIAAYEVVKKTSLTASEIGTKILKLADNSIGFMTDNQQMHLMSEFNNYILHTPGVFKDANSGIANMIKNKKHLKLIDRADGASIEKQLESFKKRESTKSLGSRNKFIHQLKIVPIKTQSFVSFNNTKFNAMLANDKMTIMQDFESLMTSDNSMDRLLAKSLADYAAIFYGYSKSVNSFMDLLPPEAHVEYMGNEDGLTSAEFFRTFKQHINNPAKFDKISEEYIDKYVARNYRRLNLPTISQTDFMLDPSEDDKGPTYSVSYNDKLKRNEVYKNGHIKLESHENDMFVKTYENFTPVEKAKQQAIPENKAIEISQERAKESLLGFVEKEIIQDINTLEKADLNSQSIAKKLLEVLESGKNPLNITEIMLKEEILDIAKMGYRTAVSLQKRGKFDKLNEEYKTNLQRTFSRILGMEGNKYLIEKIKKC
jgi:hypothetical protein